MLGPLLSLPKLLSESAELGELPGVGEPRPSSLRVLAELGFSDGRVPFTQWLLAGAGVGVFQLLAAAVFHS